MIFIKNYNTQDGYKEVKKYYPDIEEKNFYKICEADPTGDIENDKKGYYTQWLLDLYKGGKLNLNDLDKAKDLLERFNNVKNNMNNKDIGQFKSLRELAYSLRHEEHMMFSAESKEKRFQKEAHQAHRNIILHAILVYEDDTWEIWSPKDFAGACALGRNTKWCTSSPSIKGQESYLDYTSKGNLYVFIDKNSRKSMYQFHPTTNSFSNYNDETINISEFFQQYPDVYSYFKENHLCKIFLHKLDIPGDLKIVTADYINKFDKSEIIEVILNNGIEIIDEGAFMYCHNLKNVEFPSSLKEIKRNAFFSCDSLEQLNLPNSLISIGAYAFGDCESINELILPNNLKYIGQSAFTCCEGLTRIILPNGLNTIDKYAFDSCSSLTNILIPNSVQEIKDYIFVSCPSDLIIYCEATEPKSSWSKDWNKDNLKVVWNCRNNTQIETSDSSIRKNKLPNLMRTICKINNLNDFHLKYQIIKDEIYINDIENKYHIYYDENMNYIKETNIHDNFKLLNKALIKDLKDKSFKLSWKDNLTLYGKINKKIVKF